MTGAKDLSVTLRPESFLGYASVEMTIGRFRMTMGG